MFETDARLLAEILPEKAGDLETRGERETEAV